MTSATELEAAPVCETIGRLGRRIAERFPQSGLSRVAAGLFDVANENERVIAQLRQPLWWLRALSTLTIAALLALVAWAAWQLLGSAKEGAGSLPELLQAIDAATNEVIFLSIALIFLVSIETRLKRRTALRMLHRLRGFAHVVDMHQLTKDPEHVLHRIEDTESSPARNLTRDQLVRYLDYCSELLALTSKLAALHSQHLQDPVVLDAVNDVETLTADLSRKIWQKITILDMAAGVSQSPPHSVDRGNHGARAQG